MMYQKDDEKRAGTFWQIEEGGWSMADGGPCHDSLTRGCWAPFFLLDPGIQGV